MARTCSRRSSISAGPRDLSQVLLDARHDVGHDLWSAASRVRDSRSAASHRLSPAFRLQPYRSPDDRDPLGQGPGCRRPGDVGPRFPEWPSRAPLSLAAPFAASAGFDVGESRDRPRAEAPAPGRPVGGEAVTMRPLWSRTISRTRSPRVPMAVANSRGRTSRNLPGTPAACWVILEPALLHDLGRHVPGLTLPEPDGLLHGARDHLLHATGLEEHRVDPSSTMRRMWRATCLEMNFLVVSRPSFLSSTSRSWSLRCR